MLVAAASASPRERSMLEEQVIAAYLPLASKIAGRYRGRGVDLDDLRQVANMALLKAVRRFDEERGEFGPYAAATISGEVKKYFRDFGWVVRPPRSVQLLQAAIAEATETLSQADGHAPDSTALAVELDLDRGTVEAAVGAKGCFSPASLDAPQFEDGATVADRIAGETPEFELVEEWVDFVPAWGRLTADEQRLVTLRFFEDMTQETIAGIIGISQMQVSRRLKAVLAKIRQSMDATRAA